MGAAADRPGGQRVYAIDALRGLTVAAMIVVNNAGGKLSYSCLQHSEWNGLTLCDMVFPSFLFLVGLSAYISLSKRGFAFSWPLMGKIVRRTLTILLIGWAIHWIEHVCKADFMPFDRLRLTGVLPRIALCYFFVSVIAITCHRRAIAWIIAGLLVVYSLILIWGEGYANDASNIISRVDHALLGENHIYSKRPIDPEGILGTVSGIAHTLIGFVFGRLLMRKDASLPDRLLNVMVAGFALLLAGWAVGAGLPVNKRVWSPSYVMVSCGLVAMALAAISYAADVKGRKAPFRFFDVFGVNPLFLYVLSEIASILLGTLGAKPAIYGCIVRIVGDPYVASALYSVGLMLAMWCAGYPLYKKKIYIKI